TATTIDAPAAPPMTSQRRMDEFVSCVAVSCASVPRIEVSLAIFGLGFSSDSFICMAQSRFARAVPTDAVCVKCLKRRGFGALPGGFVSGAMCPVTRPADTHRTLAADARGHSASRCASRAGGGFARFAARAGVLPHRYGLHGRASRSKLAP